MRRFANIAGLGLALALALTVCWLGADALNAALRIAAPLVLAAMSLTLIRVMLARNRPG